LEPPDPALLVADDEEFLIRRHENAIGQWNIFICHVAVSVRVKAPYLVFQTIGGVNVAADANCERAAHINVISEDGLPPVH
jgi:hypothetical protein